MANCPFEVPLLSPRRFILAALPVVLMLAAPSRAEVYDVTDPDHPVAISGEAATPMPAVKAEIPVPVHKSAPVKKKTVKAAAGQKPTYAYKKLPGMEKIISIGLLNKSPLNADLHEKGQLTYDAAMNRWNQADSHKPVCYQSTPIGPQSVPAYGQAGDPASDHCQNTLLILTNTSSVIQVRSACGIEADKMLSQILQTFRLTDPTRAVSAICIPEFDRIAGWVPPGF